MPQIQWINLFIDVNRRDLDVAVSFWQRTLGLTPSPARGEFDEFVTMLPASGSSWIRVQGIQTEDSRVHLDLCVDDVAAASADAQSLGAQLLSTAEDEHVLSSPAGVPFCFTNQKPDANGVQERDLESLLDQACLDIPSAQFDQETQFWSTLTGWKVLPSVVSGFASLERPEGIPVRITLQRTAEGHAKAHPDLASRRRPVTVREHQEAGAVVFDVHERWTVMVGPLGLRYCITERDPRTGRL